MLLLADDSEKFNIEQLILMYQRFIFADLAGTNQCTPFNSYSSTTG